MAELVSMGVRLDKKMIKELGLIAKKENLDRTAIMRRLIAKAIKDYKIDTAINQYIHEKVSISKAAADADITIFEIEGYLVRMGYKSSYSGRDLKRELSLLGSPS